MSCAYWYGVVCLDACCSLLLRMVMYCYVMLRLARYCYVLLCVVMLCSVYIYIYIGV